MIHRLACRLVPGIRLLVALVACVSLTSCEAPKVAEKVPELYWPLPPEKPRIKFVDIILGSADVQGQNSKIKGLLFGGESDYRFTKPFGVAANRRRVVVSDIGGLHVFDYEKAAYKRIGTEELRIPAGIAFLNERIYVSDLARKSIFVYDFDGKLLINFGGKELDTPAGLAADPQRGRILVADARKHAVFIYSSEGKLLKSFGERGTGEGKFNIPYDLALDGSGRIYVVDGGNFRIQIFGPDGAFIKAIGRVGTSPGNFARPKGIALDSEGHIYVLDAAFGNFQILDFDGNILLAVGNTGSDPGEFTLPSDIYIDEQDKIYVVDQINKRIQIFQYLKDQPVAGK